jgi:hypothetical protein
LPLLAWGLPAPSVRAASEGKGETASWPWTSFAAAHCYVDGLARSRYLEEWTVQAKAHPVPPTWLTVGNYPTVPKRRAGPGTPTFEADRRVLEHEWGAHAVAHLLDCGLPRPSGALYAGAPRHVPYTIFFPSDYFAAPDRPRPVLYLLAGGRGNRTRWFLPELPTSHRVRGTGGLSLPERVESWMAAHPGSPGPIVVAPENGGVFRTMEAAVDFFHDKLKKHIHDTYLPNAAPGSYPEGALAVSSGATEALRALNHDPQAFDVLGLMSLHCGGRNGLDPRTHFGGEAGWRKFVAMLAERSKAEALDVSFTMGSRDEYLPCMKKMARQMAKQGVWASGPETNACTDEKRCRRAGPAFFLYGTYGHGYGALSASFADELAWMLGALDKKLAQKAMP